MDTETTIQCLEEFKTKINTTFKDAQFLCDIVNACQASETSERFKSQ